MTNKTIDCHACKGNGYVQNSKFPHPSRIVCGECGGGGKLLTPNPQETGFKKCPTCNRTRIGLDVDVCASCSNKGRTVPQESSPGFAQYARKRIEFAIDAYVVDKKGIHGVIADATNEILAAHQKEIQAAKREEREACVKVAKWWAENDGRPKHLIQDLEEPDKSTLEHLEEETTND